MYEKKFMQEAIRLAIENVRCGTGGPFGAVVVKEGEVIAACGNTVTPDNDPTAHAEVNAIRKACQQLRSYQLEGCEIYCSCEHVRCVWGLFIGHVLPEYIMLLLSKMRLMLVLTILSSMRKLLYRRRCVLFLF